MFGHPCRAALLLHRQGVEFGADGDGGARSADPEDGTGVGDLGEGACGQCGEHEVAGGGFGAGQAGAGVDAVAQCRGGRQFLVERGGQRRQVVAGHVRASSR